ncbi:DNA-binding transcriptional regulator, XRE-family HTH domain [Eubacterium maltosivorans]|uniref:helix-turn-helix domain-containing protein n=1 Tax=Eubacterium TaxID=1730 RepID=UPI000889652D|nr:MULTISPECIES: helix-turn-helix transcriptional regulator [Eubacterium]WPK81211.1 HTH-type transcriptional regulator ImmR [Eubacterium maltosivorans]SDO66016.1 DNA-binding transcriptional regulator, XRE-family HTH domain [Eubacterium maltosivorans]
MITPGIRIKELREQAGYTQNEIAKKLNLSRSNISQWESGLSVPTLKNALQLKELYGVSLDYLMGLESKETIDISDLSNNEKEVILRMLKCLKDKENN